MGYHRLALAILFILFPSLLRADNIIRSNIDVATSSYVTGWSINLITQNHPNNIGVSIYPYVIACIPCSDGFCLYYQPSNTPMNIGYTINYGNRPDVQAYFNTYNPLLGYGINFNETLTTGEYLIQVWSVDNPYSDYQYYDLVVQ